ncbi:histidine phosphatase family protein [Mesorhizobium sp. Z1-4]|uniref:histidine phosphatase family protein n=1 Tax=Mesorhizobium sp. Z1-4 TaxID=2448478 RepID=UPI000FD7B521|nr:histidine phosphatase family protein [Mesorhizobium sp. Z1-4]
MFRIFAFLLALLFAAPAAATEAGWALLRTGGQVVLLRHAYAPGVGDPASFDIENCATQRNLSSRGQQQAREIGALFGARAAPIDHVETSRFCRCRDTANIAFRDEELRDNEALDWLPDEENHESLLTVLREQIAAYSGSRNLILVTHEEIIMELLGAKAREGEAVIVSRGGDTLGVAGRIRFN